MKHKPDQLDITNDWTDWRTQKQWSVPNSMTHSCRRWGSVVLIIRGSVRDHQDDLCWWVPNQTLNWKINHIRVYLRNSDPLARPSCALVSWTNNNAEFLSTVETLKTANYICAANSSPEGLRQFVSILYGVVNFSFIFSKADFQHCTSTSQPSNFINIFSLSWSPQNSLLIVLAMEKIGPVETPLRECLSMMSVAY
jgi:hypothetical protein